MRLVEFAAESLLCHVDDVARVPEWFTARRVLRVGDLIAFDVTNDGDALARLRIHSSDSLPRILDRFYLWTPASPSSERQCLLDALFTLTAADFNQLIHPEQNRENIQYLLKVILQHCGRLQHIRVLDFGCGPGFSGELMPGNGIELVGYDRCIYMTEMASRRGLRTLTTEDFHSLPAESFDAIFASYVFHLMPTVEDLKAIWALLRPNGIIVGNFHKHLGVDEFSKLFFQLGAQVQRLDGLKARFNHGSYWSYVRA